MLWAEQIAEDHNSVTISRGLCIYEQALHVVSIKGHFSTTYHAKLYPGGMRYKLEKRY